MGFLNFFSKRNNADSSESFLSISDILAVDFHTFKDKCDFTDSTNLFYSFTYVIDAHMRGRDLINVFSNQNRDKFYLQRKITETCPVGSPHSGVVDERTKDVAGFSSVSKRAVIEMVIDRYEWIKACNYTHNSEYETEAKNCAQILESVEDLTKYSNEISCAEKRYQWLKKLH